MTEEELQRAEEHAERLKLIKQNLELARENFSDYARLMRPDWKVVPDFHREMNSVVDRLFKGKLIGPCGEPVFNLMVNMPPRHNKSETFTKLATAWNMGRHPNRHHMTGSHSRDLAMEFGRDVKAGVQSDMHRLIFPDFALRQGAKSTHAFTTTMGGKYYASGLKGGATGRPANVSIMDDPIKNRAQAESSIQSADVWSSITSSFDRRLEPSVDGFPFIRILVMTRWDPKDPCGRHMETELWKKGGWYHLKFQGVTDMEAKTTLWPDRFPYSHFEPMIKADPIEFYSQIQQEPYIEGGSLLKRGAWGFYQPNLLERDRIMSLIIVADTAQKKEEENDPSAIAAWALMDTGDIFALDMVNRRMEYPELREFLPAYASRYSGFGLHGVHIEDKSSGSSLVQDLRATTRLPVQAWKPPYGADKVAKVRMASPMQRAGRVLLPAGAPWVEQFLQQCEQFPNSVHDDMVDNFAIAISVLSKSGMFMEGFTGSTESLKSIVSRARPTVAPGRHDIRRASLSTLLGNRDRLSRPLGA